MISTALDEFGTRIGLDQGLFSENGHVALRLGELEEVHFEPSEDHLVMYVSRKIDVGRDRLELYTAALRAVHFDNHVPARVQCALHDDQLVFLAQYDSDEVDIQELERALALLSELHTKVNE